MEAECATHPGQPAHYCATCKAEATAAAEAAARAAQIRAAQEQDRRAGR